MRRALCRADLKQADDAAKSPRLCAMGAHFSEGEILGLYGEVPSILRNRGAVDPVLSGSADESLSHFAPLMPIWPAEYRPPFALARFDMRRARIDVRPV